MANTYTQIHIQTVFAVRFRRALISSDWKHDLYKYMTGIIQKHDHKLLQINGMPDHIHILFGFRPTQALSDLMKIVKQESTNWITENKLSDGKFAWQVGYSAFSYSKSEVNRVARYIKDQEIHYLKQNFKEEYTGLLDEFEVDYEERYIFNEPI